MRHVASRRREVSAGQRARTKKGKGNVHDSLRQIYRKSKRARDSPTLIDLEPSCHYRNRNHDTPWKRTIDTLHQTGNASRFFHEYISIVLSIADLKSRRGGWTW